MTLSMTISSKANFHEIWFAHALMLRACYAGRRFGAAFCVVILLALYQLCTSGLMGVQDGIPAGVRGALLGGLAALLLPLLFLWPGSGGLLVQESRKGCCDEEEAFQHPGKVQSACTCKYRSSFHSSLMQSLRPY